jgi:hypothetical protein
LVIFSPSPLFGPANGKHPKYISHDNGGNAGPDRECPAFGVNLKSRTAAIQRQHPALGGFEEWRMRDANTKVA